MLNFLFLCVQHPKSNFYILHNRTSLKQVCTTIACVQIFQHLFIFRYCCCCYFRFRLLRQIHIQDEHANRVYSLYSFLEGCLLVVLFLASYSTPHNIPSLIEEFFFNFISFILKSCWFKYFAFSSVTLLLNDNLIPFPHLV